MRIPTQKGLAVAMLAALMGSHSAVAKEASPLAGMLKVLAADGDDDAYSNVAEVTWEGYDVADNGVSGNQNFVRNGRLLLVGLPDRDDMPRGSGADATTVKGNEGDALVSIAGFTMGPVYSVRVQKFHASKNYAELLQKQLSAAAKLTIVASDCALNEDGADGDDSKSAFFKIEFSQGDPVFARAYLSEGMKYTPELTLFEFSRDESTDLIESMKCKVKS